MMTKQKRLEVSYKLSCCVGYEPMALLHVIWDWCSFSSNKTVTISNSVLSSIMMQLPTPELRQDIEILMHWGLISVEEPYDFINEMAKNTFSIPTVPKITKDFVINRLGGMSKKGWITPREYNKRKSAYESLPVRTIKKKRSLNTVSVEKWDAVLIGRYINKRLGKSENPSFSVLQKIKTVLLERFETNQDIKDYIDDTIEYFIGRGESNLTIDVTALFSPKMISGFVYRKKKDNGLERQKNKNLPMYIPVSEMWTMDMDEIEDLLISDTSKETREHMERQIEIEENKTGKTSKLRRLL